MMKLSKNVKIVLAVFALIIVIIVLIYLNNRKYIPKYSWNENYVYSNDQPYGTNILYQLLQVYNENEFELIEQENLRTFLSKRDSIEHATYFVIGNHCNYQYDDLIALKNFVKKGNTVFMALNEVSYEFLEEINFNCYYDAYYDHLISNHKIVRANFSDSTLKTKAGITFFYRYIEDNVAENWAYFGDDFCEDSIRYQELGFINQRKANLIQINSGKGQIILLSNPLFLTNFHLIRPEGKEYFEKLMTHFPDGPIYWDRNSKLWSFSTNSYSGNKNKSPFSYILQQRALKWGFYSIWVFVFIFLLFNLWRKQRAIPVKFPKTNTTLEFFHTIGELYFSQKNNRQLALQKMDLFLKNVRAKYYINESDESKFIELLSKKSEIPIEKVKLIFIKYNKIKKSKEELSDQDLIVFYKQLESFNKKSK